MRQANPTFKLSAVLLACGALLSACGGGGGGDTSGGNVQELTFDFPTSTALATSATLKANASSGLPVTFVSDTPTICKVDGDRLTPLILGECKITATQAGGSGYAPVSQSQIFVVTKHTQAITFVAPDSLPLGSAPANLVATSNSGLPVSFTTNSAACSLSGSTVTAVSTGQCAITVTQDGDATYLAAAPVTQLIPVGIPTLTFASGYVTGGAAVDSWRPTFEITHTTAEDGAVTQGADNYLAGYGWNKSGGQLKVDGVVIGNYGNLTYSVSNSNYISSFVVTKATLDALKTSKDSWGQVAVMKAGVLAPGLLKMNSDGTDTAGLKLGGQEALTLTMSQNAEWFDTTDNKVNVDLYLGKNTPKAGSACNVKLHTVLTPTAATATKYTLNLADFTIQESCGLAETNVLTLIQANTVAEVEISTNSNINLKNLDSSGANYATVLTLGAITFH